VDVQCCATLRNAMEAQARALNATIRLLSFFVSIFLGARLLGEGGKLISTTDEERDVAGRPPGEFIRVRRDIGCAGSRDGDAWVCGLGMCMDVWICCEDTDGAMLCRASQSIAA
jgi:hypothetical protein